LRLQSSKNISPFNFSMAVPVLLETGFQNDEQFFAFSGGKLFH